MSDKDRQIKQSGKSAGARDAKSLKANANRSLEAPDMPDTEKEAAIAERMSRRGNKSKPSAVVRLVLKLAQKGYSPSQMNKISKVAPHETTIYRWMREDPDFAEEMKSHYRDFVDDSIRQALPVSIGWQKDAKRLRRNLVQAKKLVKIDGLKPFEKVQAIDRMLQRIADLTSAAVSAEDRFVHRSLQIGERQLADWRRDADVDSGMIVLDVNLTGAIKTIALPGSEDGQNAKALVAGRWKQLPEPQKLLPDAPANEKEG
jgi:hypothetical protein